MHNGLANNRTKLFVKVPTTGCLDSRYCLMIVKSCYYSTIIHKLSFLVSPTAYCPVLIICI